MLNPRKTPMPTDDIRDQLSDNHRAVMARVAALRNEYEELQCYERLEELRQEWIVREHADSLRQH